MASETSNDLKKLTKDQLVAMVLSLKEEASLLKELNAVMEKTNKRIENLERQQNLNNQYMRRDTIEIVGIPKAIEQKDLEDQVLRIYDAAGVKVNGTQVDKLQISACHRIGKKKEVTVVKFVNRKFAYECLFCGKRLKNNSPYDNAIYINNSLCKEYKFIFFKVRKAKTEGNIFTYKIKHGVPQVQFKEHDDFGEVSHKADLLKYGITADDDDE